MSTQEREQLILPPGLGRASPTSVLVLDFGGRAFQVEETAGAKGLRQTCFLRAQRQHAFGSLGASAHLGL